MFYKELFENLLNTVYLWIPIIFVTRCFCNFYYSKIIYDNRRKLEKDAQFKQL